MHSASLLSLFHNFIIFSGFILLFLVEMKYGIISILDFHLGYIN